MSSFLDVLGMAPGTLWLIVAVWFQLIHDDEIPPQWIAGMLLMGASLLMLASETALPHRPGTVQLLGVLANLILSAMAIAVAYVLHVRVDDEVTDATVDDDRSFS